MLMMEGLGKCNFLRYVKKIFEVKVYKSKNENTSVHSTGFLLENNFDTF